ncbi:MAG TPA: EcsC family protein, partial [Acidocella sp.]
MKQFPPIPDDVRYRAGFLTPSEQNDLWRAAILLADSRGLLMRMSALFGRQVEALRGQVFKTGGKIGGATWADLNQRVQGAVEDVLWNAYEVATFGLEETPQIMRPKAPRGNTLHRLATTASGGASGFVGLPGILLDIPFTTAMILRTIAEVARDHGESLTNEDTKRACLGVLAFGGLSDADEDSETGHWAARLG